MNSDISKEAELPYESFGGILAFILSWKATGGLQA